MPQEFVPKIVVAAYRTRLRDPQTTWDLLAEPTPDGRLTDQAKIAADIAKKKDKFEVAAVGLKATGDLDAVMAVCLNPEKQEVFKSQPGPSTPAAQFAEWLLRLAQFNTLPDMRLDTRVDKTGPVLFYGFELKTLLRLTGIGAIRAGQNVPIGLWYGYDACYDPFEMLVEDGFRGQISLQKLCKEAPGGEIECELNYIPGMDLAQDLRIITALCLQYQLVHPHVQVTPTETLDATTPMPDDLPDEARKDLSEDELEGDSTPAPKNSRKRQPAR